MKNNVKIEYLREKRAKLCFPIINRGQAWYDSLTESQRTELYQWYQEWLDVTETLTMPETPEWIK